MVSAHCKCESSLTPILGPFTWHRRGKRYIGAQSFDESQTFVRIQTDLVREPIAERQITRSVVPVFSKL